MRILVVSFIFPFPIDSGGARDIFSRLVILHDAGYSIDLIATVREWPTDAELLIVSPLVNSIQIVRRRRGLSDLLSVSPFHCQTRRDLRTLPLEQDYLAIILESDFVGAILDNPMLSAHYRILRVHNDEASLHRCLALGARTWRERLAFLAESLKFRFYSPALMRRCDLLWFISASEFDRASFGQSHNPPGTRLQLVPKTYAPQEMMRRPLTGAGVLYVGALSVPTNMDGLLWYIENIHPEMLNDPSYHFVIAGKRGMSGIDALIRAAASAPRIELQLDLPDLNPLYVRAAVFVNPIQRGAGVKVKTLDAAIQGLPVVTTPAGAEGTGFEDGVHVLVAKSKIAFIAGLKHCLKDKTFARSLVAQAQQLLLKQNGPDRFLDCLNTLQQELCVLSSP